MSTLWSRVHDLEGRTLVTARGSPFVVDTVTGTAVIVSPSVERAPRFIRWREFEEAFLYGPKGASQTPSPPSEPGEVLAPEATAAFVRAILLVAGREG